MRNAVFVVAMVLIVGFGSAVFVLVLIHTEVELIRRELRLLREWLREGGVIPYEDEHETPKEGR